MLCHTENVPDSKAYMNHSTFFVTECHAEAGEMELISIQHITGDGRSCVILLAMGWLDSQLWAWIVEMLRCVLQLTCCLLHQARGACWRTR